MIIASLTDYSSGQAFIIQARELVPGQHHIEFGSFDFTISITNKQIAITSLRSFSSRTLHTVWLPPREDNSHLMRHTLDQLEMPVTIKSILLTDYIGSKQVRLTIEQGSEDTLVDHLTNIIF